jgi:LL-diaminopimelate aminotransferase
MATINSHYTTLEASYLFAEIESRIEAWQEANPGRQLVKLGIGDVTRALPPAVIEAFRRGVEDQARDATFHGYPPNAGYPFLREKIAQIDFRNRGCAVEPDEVYVSDGAKNDTANFQELFSLANKVAVPDPVYPVYVDTNVMAGRTGSWNGERYEGLVYLDGTRENGFVPPPPEEPVDLVYLCFPNNPTGAVARREQLAEWVAYAQRSDAVILFDAAYVQFIRDEAIPHSIYEIPGADTVAVEFRSFSKTAGFTGTRCAYTVVPKALQVASEDGTRHSLRELWMRRQSTKFNGVSYPVQRAAEAVYSEEGQRQIRELSDYYLGNASLIRKALTDLGFFCVGGEDSPYIWFDTGADSWEFFDRLLNEAGVVVTPGAGFGRQGAGYVRVSAFNHTEAVEEALSRIAKAL